MSYDPRRCRLNFRTWTRAGLAFAGALVLVQPASADTADVAGLWLDHTGRGAVEIKPCGARMCGTIVWMQAPNDARGRPLTDGNNPNTGQRNRPVCGLQIIGDLSRMGSGRFDGGWIYNPEDGGKFDVEVTRLPGDKLKVLGYLGMKFLGETFTWTRAPQGLKRCDS